MMRTFETLESAVRTYSRSFPTVFATARGARLTNEEGREYIDFFAGAGALNYGHNNPVLKRRILEYLEGDGVLHSLDMATTAKREFLERFNDVILLPRGMADYKVQFAGPTGTNAVESALKLARKVTGRTNVVYFTNAYHGMTLGSLAVTGNATKRAGAGVPLNNTQVMPFDGFLGPEIDTLDYLEACLEGSSSGLDKPAAVILETIQAEGGVNVARPEWLRRLRALTRRHQVLLIADDIQVGCGRTGPFFSFETVDLQPDLVTLSKSISGLGLPMAIVLIRPDLDIWKPGEHNGTFRGNNLAFIAGAEALRYWEDDALTRDVLAKGALVEQRLGKIAAEYPEAIEGVRGKGLIQGLVFRDGEVAERVARGAYQRGLVIETAGPRDQVLKVLPPLLIETADLEAGLGMIEESAAAVLSHAGGRTEVAEAVV
jgi:diaminobutyrate-2-oxoglutarate transaminase